MPRAAKPLPPGLYLVATPIGNLGDITLRALEILRQVDLIACEDTRVTAALSRRYGLDAERTAYHDHNAEHIRPRLLARLSAGARIALVSDAGTPLISDPGFKLVRAAIEAGITVTAIPGASAPLAALMVAGLPTDRFLFQGFLPPKPGARRRTIETLAEVPATLVFFETAPRLVGVLGELAAVLGNRPAAVARELTKLHEEVRRDSLAALAAFYREHGPPKGEIVLVVGPPRAADAADALDTAALEQRLRVALETMSIREASAAIAAETGRPRREVYALALTLQGKRGG
ncbi:MAG TPA: 16S rRNA (cytidine(1402)-2'-O)-methyltransferase [Stellaceae bacterium]|nr:16S rRNA (cytidine(1402)-2'-O)-methyltransferase [Stellaceae bacterium]